MGGERGGDIGGGGVLLRWQVGKDKEERREGRGGAGGGMLVPQTRSAYSKITGKQENKTEH